MGGFVLWVCPDTLDRPSRHWTDRPERRHHTHLRSRRAAPGGSFQRCRRQLAGGGCPFESNVTTKTQEKELRNEAARGLTAGFRGSGVCVGVPILYRTANISTAIQAADAQTILNAASARMLRVSCRVM